MNLNTATNEQLDEYRLKTASILKIDPFMLDYIWMSDPETGLKNRVLYAKRGAAEVLRQNMSISVESLVPSVAQDGLLSFMVTGKDKTGRQEIAVGSAYLDGLKGDKKAHAVMTAQTRAVRRLTLQFVGGGILDETEVQSQSALQAAPAASEATLAGSPTVLPPPAVAPSAEPGKDITPLVNQAENLKQVYAEGAAALAAMPIPQPVIKADILEHSVAQNPPQTEEEELSYYERNREEVIRKAAQWKKDNPERAREIRRKDHRKSRGVKNPTGETKQGPCEVCGRVTALCYDHDAQTGEFRGWLCSPCNIALGYWEKIDDEGLNEKFKNYVGKSAQETSANNPDIKTDIPATEEPRKKRQYRRKNQVNIASPGQASPEPSVSTIAEKPPVLEAKTEYHVPLPPHVGNNVVVIPDPALKDVPIQVSVAAPTQVPIPSVPVLSKEKQDEYRTRLSKYYNDILPRGGMQSSENIGGPTMKTRKFAAIHTGVADTKQMTEQHWEDLFEF